LTPTIQEHLLEKLRLSIGEAARVTGVSVRQLSYWTAKGLVRALGTTGKKRYDFRALERISLIKRHLSEGYTLEDAARQVDHWLRTRLAESAEPHQVIAERLAELEELVSYLRLRVAHTTNKAALASTATKLSQLNLAALFDHQRPPRRRLVRSLSTRT